MTSIQERLQLKRVPLDKWSIREQLCLASAVSCSGDQNWMSVSRTLKMMCGGNRPSDWFSQKSCAVQYGKLLENVETPKRKKRTEKDNAQTPVETPSELIVRKLTDERMADLIKLIQEEQKDYTKTKDEILLIQSNTVDEGKLREMWTQIELEKKQREKEQLQHAQWLKEREERKMELERAWRPNAHLYQQNSPNQSPSKTPQLNVKIKSEDMEVDDANLRQGTSPLLTSLLKSPSPAPNPANTMLMSANSSSTASNSSRVVAPTITNLLTGSSGAHSISSTTAGPTQTNTFPVQLMTQSLTGPPPYEQANSANVVQSPSQAAPTLSMLLENKAKDSIPPKMPPLARMDSSQTMAPSTATDSNQFGASTSSKNDLFPVGEPVGADEAGSPIKDEDQQLMEVFNGLIPDNIDELANILQENNAIILNSELLEEDTMLENVESLMAEQEHLDEKVDIADAFNAIGGFQGVSAHSSHNEPVTDDHRKATDTGSIAQTSAELKQELCEDTSALDEPPLPVAAVVHVIKDDDQSDFSNDAPLSQLRLTKTDDKKPKTDETAAAPIEMPTVNIDDDDDDDDDDVREVVVVVEQQKEQPTDAFDSDSNDDKCLESIKREIHELTGLKESSDNSNEETDVKIFEPMPPETDDTVAAPAAVLGTDVEKVADADKDIVVISDKDVEVNEGNNEPSAAAEAIEIVEIKDDKSDDDKQEAFILIEETDDANSEETVSDKVKMETVNIKDDEEPPERKTSFKDRKLSSDDEFFEDAKENIDDVKSDDVELISEPKSVDQTITIIDTDDDSPIEVIKDDKSGKTKRDYSRRKHEQSSTEKRTSDETHATPTDESKANLSVRMKLKERDRSESPYVDEDGDSHLRSKRRYSSTPVLDSLPNSPASSNDEREYRVWKKSILMVYNRLCNHKCSGVFMKPITDDQAPGYKNTIFRPMDLHTIKRNIESGAIRTTAEFQRDVMLMCYNAIMYNSRDHLTRSMGKEMMTEALQSIEIIMDTWKREHEKSVIPAPGTPVAGTSGTSVLKVGRGRKSHRLPAVP